MNNALKLVVFDPDNAKHLGRKGALHLQAMQYETILFLACLVTRPDLALSKAELFVAAIGATALSFGLTNGMEYMAKRDQKPEAAAGQTETTVQ